MFSECITNNIPPQMKNLNMVIPILMHFCLKLEHCKPHKAASHPTKCDIINESKSNYFRRYFAGYSVTNFQCYPIRYRVTKSSGLE